MAAKDFPKLRRPLKYSRESDQGRQRNNNEDLTAIDPEQGIFVVIDGVGGHAAGEIAAQVALEHLMARLKDPLDILERRMREAIAIANREIYEQAQKDEGLRGMACVLTAAVIEDDKMTIGHVGDTRLYKIRFGKIRKLTHDHSPVGEMEDHQEISEQAAMQHPRRNEIFRDVGSELHDPDDEDFIEIIHGDFEPDSSVLICSDGLTDMVSSNQILDVINKNAGNPDSVVRELIAAANDAGGKDNISVIYVEGELFASSIRQPTVVQAGPRPVPSVFQEGAGLVRKGFVEPKKSFVEKCRAIGTAFISMLRSRLAVFIYGALTGIFLLYIMQEYFGINATNDVGNRSEQRSILRVASADRSAYATISEAMEKARAGDIIEVATGRYAEQVIMKEGVVLVSKKPREAVILSPESESPLVAVIIEGVKSGRFEGFKIEDNQKGALSIGIRLVNSAVEIIDVEVTNAREAGIEIEGGSSTLRACYLHDNPGAGVVIKGEGESQLVHNKITRNGKQGPKQRAGIEVLDSKARFENIFNSIEDNAINEILKSGDKVEGRNSGSASQRRNK